MMVRMLEKSLGEKYSKQREELVHMPWENTLKLGQGGWCGWKCSASGERRDQIRVVLGGIYEQKAAASSAVWKQTPVWSQKPVLIVFSFRILEF